MRELRIYKPNKAKGGAGAKFQPVNKKNKKKDKEGKEVTFTELMLFLGMGRQGPDREDGNNSFLWDDPENSVNVKLSELDAAKLMTVLFGLAPKTELYHDPSKSATGEANKGVSKVISLSKNTEGKSGYYLTLSSKQGDKQIKIGVGISDEEAILMKYFLGRFIEEYYLGD